MNIAVQSSLPIHDVERICNKISHELKENIDVTHKGGYTFNVQISTQVPIVLIKFTNRFNQYSRQEFLRNLCLEVDNSLACNNGALERN